MPEIRPELHRRTLGNTSKYTKIIEIRRVNKIGIISIATNTGTIRLAREELDVNEAEHYFPLEVGDSVVFEATVSGEALSWTLWARPETANDILVIVLWR